MLSFLPLTLFALCAQAAPALEAAGHGNVAQYGTGGGIVGFLVLLLDIYVFVELANSSRPTARKFLWAIFVFLFPVVGLLVYWLFADRQRYNEYSAIGESA